jgi:ankyrin repeat protein
MKCITELITRKAKLNLSDNEGCWPLDLSAKYGLVELLQLLAEHGADVNHRFNKHILYLILIRSKNGYKPIHWACTGGHNACVTALVALGCNIDGLEEEMSQSEMKATSMRGM